MDISGVAIDWARRDTSAVQDIRYLIGDLGRADWQRPGRFNLVLDGTCLHCLIGVRRRRHFLNHARALLAPNGVLVIGTIINPGTGTRWWWRGGRRWRELVDLDTLCRQLNEAGLVVIDSERRNRERWHFVRLFARARSRN